MYAKRNRSVMLIDAAAIIEPKEESTEVCIIGGGPAGITLALELEKRNIACVLLESGGTEKEENIQDLNKGTTSGFHYHSLRNSRPRYLGGATNHWGAVCMLMESNVFEPRDWIGGYSWPFSWGELKPYYIQACGYCNIDLFPELREEGPPVYAGTVAAGQGNMKLKPLLRQIGATESFGKRYLRRIKNSKKIKAYLHADFQKFIFAGNDSVQSVECDNHSGTKITISARHYVLATGGIENARLLLLNQSTVARRMGESFNMVGKNFADHIGAQIGLMVAHDDILPRSKFSFEVADRRLIALTPSTAVRRELRLLNSQTYFRNMPHNVRSLAMNDFGREYVKILPDISGRKAGKFYTYSIEILHEQLPVSESYVGLSGDETDSFGRPSTLLHWNIKTEEKESIIKTARLIARRISQIHGGRICLWVGEDAPFGWDILSGAYHHMGTTRMSTEPSRGVVDEQCKVHGIRNLSIAGSSVFPVTGEANPTLTIIAMVIRQAEFISGILRNEDQA